MTSTAPQDELHQAAIQSAGRQTHGTANTLLSIVLADKHIVCATFQPSGETRVDAWRELYCRTIEGLPAEEAAAYGASYVLYRMVQSFRPSCTQGIITPSTLAPALAEIEQALRAHRTKWRSTASMEPIETAAFLSVPANWQELSSSERLNRLRTSLCNTVEKGSIPDLGLMIERLENDNRGRPVRITLTYAKEADTAQLPGTMRAIERLLRHEIAPWLEIYAEERQDHNKLRRTILIDQRPASKN